MKQSPASDDALAVVRGVLGALGRGGTEPAPVQLETLAAFAELALDCPVDVASESGLEPDALAAALTDPALRRLTVTLLVTMEFVLRSLPTSLDASVHEYARALGVSEPLVKAAHAMAHHHTAVMYADIQRHSWYAHETARRVLGGHVFDLLRSKIASLGGPTDEAMAARWRALGDCPPASWGRAVHDFYVAHGFAFPGERDSIRSVGAEHDWIHVLAGYDTEPEGEIDVFTFIAGSMDNEQGMAMLASTLSLFQNGSFHRIAGRPISIARADTLSQPGATRRFADAFRRGRATNVDVLSGIDRFEWADVPLDEARTRLSVGEKQAG